MLISSIFFLHFFILIHYAFIKTIYANSNKENDLMSKGFQKSLLQAQHFKIPGEQLGKLEHLIYYRLK